MSQFALLESDTGWLRPGLRTR